MPPGRRSTGSSSRSISDGDGTLFRALTNGWVPWSVLVGPDGKVVFSENEFDESGFSIAIQQMYERPAAREAGRAPVGGVGGLHRRPGWRHRRARRRTRAPGAAPGRPPGRARRPRGRPRLPAVAAVADGGRAPPEPVQPAARSGCRRKGIEFRQRRSRGARPRQPGRRHRGRRPRLRLARRLARRPARARDGAGLRRDGLQPLHHGGLRPDPRRARGPHRGRGRRS